MRTRRLTAPLIVSLLLAALSGCDTGVDPLAEYLGSRPLIIQSITQSHAPDIQWVGGRIAAIGINRGEQAALDSTLVWVHRVDGNDIEAPIYVRDVLDANEVSRLGGTPTDSLEADEVYTLWLADREALEVGLHTTAVDRFTFADTTFTTTYQIRGRSGGGVDVEFRLVRDQRLVSDQYTMYWTPADQAFRRLAIRNASGGGFSELLWHVVLPDDLPDAISSPVVIGQAPLGAIVAVEWEGFSGGLHTFWAATSQWNGTSFGFTTPGYSFYQIFAGQF